jgi:hypothetical protein
VTCEFPGGCEVDFLVRLGGRGKVHSASTLVADGNEGEVELLEMHDVLVVLHWVAVANSEGALAQGFAGLEATPLGI